MDPKERYEATRQNMLTLTNLQEPKKVPTFISMDGWTFKYAGVKRQDVDYDPTLFAQTYTKAYRDLPIDVVSGYGPVRMSLAQPKALGNERFSYTSDGTGLVHDQASDMYFGPEVYDDIINDPQGLRDRWSRQNYPIFNGPMDLAVEGIKKAGVEALKYREAMELIAKTMRDDIGIFSFGLGWLDSTAIRYGWTSEYWTFYDSYRGPHNALADLRRRPEKVYAAVEHLYAQSKARQVYDEASMKEPFPTANTMFHPEGYLSPKHFDDFYFSKFMEILGPVMNAGKKVWLYGEGSFLHHLHRFLETPKGSMIIALDQDDPFEAKKIVGDWCTLVTGPKHELMRLGTVSQVKDYVKRCFDELAPGGGYIFGLGSSLVTGMDATVENMFAAYETAYELGTQG